MVSLHLILEISLFVYYCHVISVEWSEHEVDLSQVGPPHARSDHPIYIYIPYT